MQDPRLCLKGLDEIRQFPLVKLRPDEKSQRRIHSRRLTHREKLWFIETVHLLEDKKLTRLLLKLHQSLRPNHLSGKVFQHPVKIVPRHLRRQRKLQRCKMVMLVLMSMLLMMMVLTTFGVIMAAALAIVAVRLRAHTARNLHEIINQLIQRVAEPLNMMFFERAKHLFQPFQV